MPEPVGPPPTLSNSFIKTPEKLIDPIIDLLKRV